MKNTVSFCGRTPPPTSPDLSPYLRPLLILRTNRGDLCVRMRRIMGYVTDDVMLYNDFSENEKRRYFFFLNCSIKLKQSYIN